jgi:hypothetical protein
VASRGLAGVTSEDPVGGPGCRPAEGEISPWQEHEAGTRKFAGGGVSCRIPKQVSSVRRIAQVAHEAGSIGPSPPSDVVHGLGADSGDDHAPGLGQCREAGDAGKPGQRWHERVRSPSLDRSYGAASAEALSPSFEPLHSRCDRRVARPQLFGGQLLSQLRIRAIQSSVIGRSLATVYQRPACSTKGLSVRSASATWSQVTPMSSGR